MATQLLADEMLDAYDSPATRKIIKDAFTGILTEICKDVEDVSAGLKEYIEGKLNPNLDKVSLQVLLKLKKILRKVIFYFIQDLDGRG